MERLEREDLLLILKESEVRELVLQLQKIIRVYPPGGPRKENPISTNLFDILRDHLRGLYGPR